MNVLRSEVAYKSPWHITLHIFSRGWSFRGKSEKACCLYAQGCDVVCPKPWLRGLQGSSKAPHQVHPWVTCDLHFGKQANRLWNPKECSAIPLHQCPLPPSPSHRPSSHSCPLSFPHLTVRPFTHKSSVCLRGTGRDLNTKKLWI